MSQNVLTLLCHVTIKHPGTVLFYLTDSADGAAGQTGRTVPFESQNPKPLGFAASRVEELFVAQVLIKKVKLKCCGIWV